MVTNIWLATAARRRRLLAGCSAAAAAAAAVDWLLLLAVGDDSGVAAHAAGESNAEGFEGQPSTYRTYIPIYIIY